MGELAARKYAEDNGLKFVSPYNDYEVIAGQVRSQNECHKENILSILEILSYLEFTNLTLNRERVALK